MTGDQLKQMRREFGLTRHDFAVHIIGYTGNDRNVELRMRRLENERHLPLHLARFLYLVWKDYQIIKELPRWPESLQIEGETPPWM